MRLTCATLALVVVRASGASIFADERVPGERPLRAALVQCGARAPRAGEREPTIEANAAYAAMHNYSYAIYIPQADFQAHPSWCAPLAVFEAAEARPRPQAVLFLGAGTAVLTDKPLELRELGVRARAIALAGAGGAEQPENLQRTWEAADRTAWRLLVEQANVAPDILWLEVPGEGTKQWLHEARTQGLHRLQPSPPSTDTVQTAGRAGRRKAPFRFAIPGGGLRPPPDPHPHCAARGSTGLLLGAPRRAARRASRPQSKPPAGQAARRASRPQGKPPAGLFGGVGACPHSLRTRSATRPHHPHA